MGYFPRGFVQNQKPGGRALFGRTLGDIFFREIEIIALQVKIRVEVIIFVIVHRPAGICLWGGCQVSAACSGPLIVIAGKAVFR
jgi:hypothetical protein